MAGVPLKQIGLTNLGLVTVLLVASVALLLTGHTNEGNVILGTAVGVVSGGGLATAVVSYKAGAETPPEAPK